MSQTSHPCCHEEGGSLSDFQFLFCNAAPYRYHNDRMPLLVGGWMDKRHDNHLLAYRSLVF